MGNHRPGLLTGCAGTEKTTLEAVFAPSSPPSRVQAVADDEAERDVADLGRIGGEGKEPARAAQAGAGRQR